MPPLDGAGRVVLEIDRCDLAAGAYYVDVAVYERAWTYAYDSHWHVYPFYVRGSVGKGVMSAPHRWRLEREASRAPSADRPVTRKG